MVHSYDLSVMKHSEIYISASSLTNAFLDSDICYRECETYIQKQPLCPPLNIQYELKVLLPRFTWCTVNGRFSQEVHKQVPMYVIPYWHENSFETIYCNIRYVYT